jgi:eukaryotic-like serine/threonine-protein kinase
MLGAGAKVGDKLKLIRLIAKGGMGSVWLAEHLGLDTNVAVKFMSPEAVQHPEAVERFRREATAAAKLKSPHVVQILDHGVTSDGAPYIVMELLEGEDLGRRIQKVGALDLPLVVDIVRQTCKALGRAHQLGIVHRDIKPENIYLTDSDGELLVKVLDFGIAKRMEQDSNFSMTTTGVTIGSPYYMSPEQLMSAKGADTRSDIWSLGVVAYHALTGVVPFEGETMAALCVAINAADYELASKRRPDLPKTIDEFLAKLLARNPDDRFQSAKEVGHGILLAADGRSPDASNPRHSLSGEEASDLRAMSKESLFGNTMSEAKTTPHLSIDVPEPPTTVLENQSPVFARTHGIPNRLGPLKRSWLVGGVIAGVALFALIVLGVSALRASPEGTVEPVASPNVEPATEPPTAPPVPTPVVTTATPVVDEPPDAAPASSKPKKPGVPKVVPVPTGKKRKDRGF